MTRVLREAPVTTRNARSRLATGVHWRAIDPDIHLGYRRGVRGGRWLVRWYRGDSTYTQETFGTADDALDADGATTLSFDQAVRRARDLVSAKRAAEIATAAGPVVTVASAVEAYVGSREMRERSAKGPALKRDARSRLTRYVLNDVISTTPLHLMTEADLEGWRDRLPTELASATVRRLINDFKAALNLAARAHRSRLPASLGVASPRRYRARTVSPGRSHCARTAVLTPAGGRSSARPCLQLMALHRSNAAKPKD